MAEFLDSWDNILSGCHTPLFGRFLRTAIDSFSVLLEGRIFQRVVGQFWHLSSVSFHTYAVGVRLIRRWPLFTPILLGVRSNYACLFSHLCWQEWGSAFLGSLSISWECSLANMSASQMRVEDRLAGASNWSPWKVRMVFVLEDLKLWDMLSHGL